MNGKVVPLAQRFWPRVRVTSGCWEWSGARRPQGYGSIGLFGLWTEGTHRVAWLLSKGAIPDGLHVLHRCDNPPCCNPDHLFLGTNEDNVADKMAKGRLRGGSSKLAAADPQGAAMTLVIAACLGVAVVLFGAFRVSGKGV